MGISIFGFPSFHDEQGGKIRGLNTMVVVRQDGVNVAHLGDLGHPLSKEQVERLGVVDVLLIPVGGLYTIDAGQAAEIIEAIEPSVAIPMHYHQPSLSESFSGLANLDQLLKGVGKEGTAPQEKLTVSPESLPAEPTIVVLNPVQ
jgi:L-ascorbate metabolism protein UlaG (beta-lactamase superfamily)